MAAMEIYEDERTVSRADLAGWLRQLAHQLDSEGKIFYGAAGAVAVTDQVECELEIERDGAEISVEIEFSWTDPAAATSAAEDEEDEEDEEDGDEEDGDEEGEGEEGEGKGDEGEEGDGGADEESTKPAAAEAALTSGPAGPSTTASTEAESSSPAGPSTTASTGAESSSPTQASGTAEPAGEGRPAGAA
ncbi:hypothetical protein C6361_22155 [Plantactinospora sp. BC1]|uniref:amphi-Trp domain-containing protein n=1 Tax=Plantactinospora sp. BC1 TaxID=2108470 RepID=UPI000D16E462|nr:amphi-Trp domain-containing protein [Plantactinospora sp. BC1]AVT31726.1 hypothetical protein C6361_22155 [Plantactinospora sp. BC1]